MKYFINATKKMEEFKRNNTTTGLKKYDLIKKVFF